KNECLTIRHILPIDSPTGDGIGEMFNISPQRVIQETMHSLISGQQAIQGAIHSLLSTYRFIRGTTESRINDQRACGQTFHPSQRTQENNTVYQQQRR
ncbi:hypothetical protein TNCV_4946211, partial [Trichonephila clavipes]